MCDYSLEMYASRPAREGEQYQTTRFASGSIGVTVPKDGTTAICIACDTRLEIENIPATVRDGCGVGPREVVTFSSLPYGGYRDAVMFENGKQVSAKACASASCRSMSKRSWNGLPNWFELRRPST